MKTIHKSIENWHEYSLKGINIPLRTQINGTSMLPLIRRNMDYVTIIPIHDTINVGDIILFTNSDKDTYILHRVWKKNNDKYQTWGDNCISPDPWITQDLIWGKAILIERGSKKISPNPQKGIFFAKLIHKVQFLKRGSYHILSKVYHLIFK